MAGGTEPPLGLFPYQSEARVVMPPDADKAKRRAVPPPGTPGGDQRIVPK